MLCFLSNYLRPIVALVMCGLLSGCMTNSAFPGSGGQWFGSGAAGEADMSPAQRQMRQQTTALNKTVWQGAAVGAIAGGLAGALIDHNNWLRGGLIGAISGGLAGGAAGQYVAARQRQAGSTLN